MTTACDKGLGDSQLSKIVCLRPISVSFFYLTAVMEQQREACIKLLT